MFCEHHQSAGRLTVCARLAFGLRTGALGKRFTHNKAIIYEQVERSCYVPSSPLRNEPMKRLRSMNPSSEATR